MGGAAHIDEVRVNTLHHTATHCSTLQHTATHFNTLQQHTATQNSGYSRVHSSGKGRLTATHSNTHRLGIAATRCKNKNAGNKNKTAQIDFESLQHTATHFNALQHCNAL